MPLVACQTLLACGDPRASALLECAHTELQARAGRIADGDVRRDYLAVAEHRAIMALFDRRDHG